MARKTRKIKDKWKEKKWVSVKAPDSFNNITIGYIPITDDEKAKGRVLEVTLFDILKGCLLYTSPSPRDKRQSRMPSSA